MNTDATSSHTTTSLFFIVTEPVIVFFVDRFFWENALPRRYITNHKPYTRYQEEDDAPPLNQTHRTRFFSTLTRPLNTFSLQEIIESYVIQKPCSINNRCERHHPLLKNDIAGDQPRAKPTMKTNISHQQDYFSCHANDAYHNIENKRINRKNVY